MNQGTFRLFRFSGIDVFLHWSWFVVALFEINGRTHVYSSVLFNVLEYLGLFLIVLLHEFGHALACKQVGGTANRIVLWPLGGVAYVSPPPRPGANLWSIAAGPLVNVVLVPVFLGLGYVSRSLGIPQTMPDLHALLRAVAYINGGLLVFNLLPIYPLDGGQILRSLLWFVLGRARSLMIAAGFGLLGVLGMAALAVKIGSGWFGILAVYAGMSCWNGLKQARALSEFAKLPRRLGYACPSCKASPPIGKAWGCGTCHSTFDTFEMHATCPGCGAQFAQTRCLDCGAIHAFREWSPVPMVLTANAPN
jgi:Zn-dependent protease